MHSVRQASHSRSMNRVSIYQIPVTSDALAAAITTTSTPPALVEPLQAMVASVAHRTAEAPLRIYVCADDELSAARDGFAAVFAKALSAHVPSTLVVDCDFLKIGLHGLVPQPDALGLLDFLLYGSSIGVVTQEPATGVRVVGAGSFPVTKRMPFVASAFDDAARRLAAHARCAVFVGPLTSEDGTVHPLTAEADLTIVLRGDEVRRPRSAGAAGAIEELIASNGVDVWSLRPGAPERKPDVTPKPEPRAVVPPVAAKPRPAPAPTPSPKADATPRPAPIPKPRADVAEPLETPQSRYGSLIPRIAVLVFALLVIGFVSWWIWQQKAGRQPDETPTTSAATPATPVRGLEPVDTVATVSADTMRAALGDSTSQVDVPPAPVRPSDTGGKTGGTVLVNPDDILVMADLEARWKDWFAIHISSFQESIRAREEVEFLQSREFPVFIVFLDLGAKGKWYRVYAGPFETREEARDVKKNLDAIPQVRFTRITKIPE